MFKLRPIFPFLWFLLLALGGCSGSDNPSGPDPVETVANLEFEIPETIVPGQEFDLRIVAVGTNGTRPFTSFSGSVGLAVSSGTVGPSAVDVTDGEGQAQVIVETTASSVEFSALHASATGTANVTCTQPGSVLVTSGRFFLFAGGTAKTQEDDDADSQQEEVSIPGMLDFSRSVSVEGEAQFQGVSQLFISSFYAEGSLSATSTLAGSNRLVSMSILGNGTAGGAFNGSSGQGSGTSAMNALVQFAFTVEGVPVVAEVGGEVVEASYFIKNGDGLSVVSTFGDHSAELAPGDYSFRASLQMSGGTTGSVPEHETTGNMDLTLGFTEVPDAPERR